MFGYETNQTQINRLDKQYRIIRDTLQGSGWNSGLEHDVSYQKTQVNNLESTVNRLSTRLTVLEEIVRESGLITDFDNDEVKIREDRKFDIYGGIDVKQTPYQINKVKVL